jgi:hypothetical protein
MDLQLFYHHVGRSTMGSIEIVAATYALKLYSLSLRRLLWHAHIVLWRTQRGQLFGHIGRVPGRPAMLRVEDGL